MVDKKLLKEIGFVQGNGFDHDVLVYDGSFWVHYGYGKKHQYNYNINAEDYTAKEFFNLFLEYMQDEARESERYSIQGY